MERTQFVRISMVCVLVLLLAAGMGMFPGKAQAAWERYPAFVTFNSFPDGNAIGGSMILDDNMSPGEGFVSGYENGTYPYDDKFEVTAWIKNLIVKKPSMYSFWVFIADRAALDPAVTESWQEYAAAHRTVVLDFTSPQDPAVGDNVYDEAVIGWTVPLHVPFAIHNKLPSLLKMKKGDTLSATEDEVWFGFVVPGLTKDSIDEERDIEVDNIGYGQLIVFWMRFDSEILAEYDGTTPPNPVNATLANKWILTNTSPLTLVINEKVMIRKKAVWRDVPLAQYDMPFQLTMILVSENPLAPGKDNVLSTFWGQIKAK